MWAIMTCSPATSCINSILTEAARAYRQEFVKLAEAYNALGLRATKVHEVEPVIRRALAEPGPVIMDFVVEREEGVYPMVPAGASIREMLLV